MNQPFNDKIDATDRRIRALLEEARRYEPEAPAPATLVSDALTRRLRTGGCPRPLPILRLTTPLGGFALALTAAFLIWPHHLPESSVLNVRSRMPSPLRRASHLLTSIAPTAASKRLAAVPALRRLELGGRGITAHARHRRNRLSIHTSSQPASVAGAAFVWKTETVVRQNATQSLTPVWVAQPDPHRAGFCFAPALLQISLMPEDEDTDTAPSVTLIAIPIEKESDQP